MNENFGNFIKEQRKDCRLTQKDLAKILGVSDKAVSKWEVGDSYPDITLLQPISEAFGISVDELLQGKVNTKMSSIRNRSKVVYFNIASNIVLILVIIMLIFLTLLETDSSSSVAFSITDQKQFIIVSLILLMSLSVIFGTYNFLQFKKIERRKENEEIHNR